MTLTVKGIAYLLQTNQSGYVSLHLSLQPSDTSVNMYQVLATFNGTNPRSISLNGSDPYGDQYAVCTTNQYDLRPSTNSSTLAVLLQSTDAITATQTMKDMQDQAEQNGTLSVYSEFSWWYPWYRLHFSWRYDGQLMLDVGVAILPGADTAIFPDTTFKGKIDEWFIKIAFNVFVGLGATEIALWAASNWGLLGFSVVLAGYYIYKLASLYSGWGSVESLYVSLVSNLVSTAYSAWRGLCSFLPASLQALAAGAESIKNVAFAFLCKLIPINLILVMMTWNRIVELGGV
jgi:hypothetical protein